MSDTPNNITLLLTALCGPVQDVENALAQLYAQRALDVAVGAQLDVLGKIVGQDRNGLSDDDYRRYIRARIAAHRSGGVPEDVLRVASLILNVATSGVLIVRDVEDATYILEVRDHAVDAATATALRDLTVAATSAGVRVVVVYSALALAQTFQLDVGPGLDVGHLARGVDYQSTI